MNKEIAVILDDKGQLTDFFKVAEICVYEKTDSWEVTRCIKDIVIDASNMIKLRASLEAIEVVLGECRIIIGDSIIGVPYHFMDKKGFVMCEAEELNDLLLDQVYEDYCVEKEMESPEFEDVPITPQPVDHDGNFFLDFAKVQINRPEISSKKALLPFLSHELFQTLTIVCTHVMPWLETFVKERELVMNLKKEDGLYTVLITHKYCEEI